MRHEVKEVKRLTTIFIADDGTEFFDHDKCKAYEMSLLEKNLILYSKEMTTPVDFYSCWFVYIRNEEDERAFVTLSEYHNQTVRGIIGPGVYAYDSDYDRWICISDIVDKIRNKERENEKT
jgi:hypothetical protein